jgi:hypothetical protein
MPIVANLHATTLPHQHHPQNTGHDDSGLPSPKPDSGNAEDFPLLFPSDICGLAVCDPKLLELEWSLRYAQANDALTECRSHIRLRSQLLRFKAQNICGQGANTRAHKTVDTVEDRLAMSHAKYCCAHKALLALSTHVDHVGWQQSFQPLRKSDLRAMGDFGGQTQGTAIMSWIWLTHGVSANDSAGLQDALCVEWCKARARHNRWYEEIRLLMEEMRCVLAFLKWHIQWWEERATLRTFARAEETEGFVAYAKHQGAARRALLMSFEDRWAGVPVLVESAYGNADIVEDTLYCDEGPSLEAPPLEDID